MLCLLKVLAKNSKSCKGPWKKKFLNNAMPSEGPWEKLSKNSTSDKGPWKKNS